MTAPNNLFRVQFDDARLDELAVEYLTAVFANPSTDPAYEPEDRTVKEIEDGFGIPGYMFAFVIAHLTKYCVEELAATWNVTPSQAWARVLRNTKPRPRT